MIILDYSWLFYTDWSANMLIQIYHSNAWQVEEETDEEVEKKKEEDEGQIQVDCLYVYIFMSSKFSVAWLEQVHTVRTASQNYGTEHIIRYIL